MLPEAAHVTCRGPAVRRKKPLHVQFYLTRGQNYVPDPEQGRSCIRRHRQPFSTHSQERAKFCQALDRLGGAIRAHRKTGATSGEFLAESHVFALHRGACSFGGVRIGTLAFAAACFGRGLASGTNLGSFRDGKAQHHGRSVRKPAQRWAARREN